MAYLGHGKMVQPQNDWWQQFFIWLKDNWFYLGIIGLLWKAIDKTFKFLSDGRDDRTRKIVQEELKPIEEKIDKMQDSIFNIKSR